MKTKSYSLKRTVKMIRISERLNKKKEMSIKYILLTWHDYWSTDITKKLRRQSEFVQINLKI